MKLIISVLVILPFMATAQMKSSSKKDTPLIESITSDTISGTCKVIVFEYDQLKRVIIITDKEIEIKKGPKTSITSEERVIKVQKFQYQQNEQIPVTRRVISFEYDDTSMVQVEELQYFLFKNGQRIGDSTIYPGTDQQKADTESGDKNSPKRVAHFKQTLTKVIHVLDLRIKNPDTYIPANVYADSFAISKQKNIGFESSIHDNGDKFYPQAYFTFNKFDEAINPLHQLNIAPLLSNEKITIGFTANEKELNDSSFNYGNIELNWHYLNQNNPLKYAIERGETETPFRDIIQLSYTYNKFHQPTYCKTSIKKVMNNDTDHKYADLARSFKKSFTFKYRYFDIK